MKKLFLLFAIFTLSLGLNACEETNLPDTTPPVFEGLSDINYEIGQPTPDYRLGVTAIDAIDGDLTRWIEINSDNVDWMQPGSYTIIYWIIDNRGNVNEQSRTIIVSAAPVLDLVAPLLGGTKNHNHVIGDPHPDYVTGVYAYDAVDGTITSLIDIDDSGVNYEVEGSYPVIYQVSDKSGNETIVTIIVTVVQAPDPNQIGELNIYYINDTHGAILNSGNQIGLSRIGNLVMNERSLKLENTLFIAGGDILQGTLISNYFNGASTMDALNTIGLDAFVLGNHEFDWGLETVTSYFDPNTTGLKANFPLLGANVFIQGTTTRPDHIDAYTIVQKGNIKVGIIGVMGYGLESSIAQSRIDGYYFADPVIWVEHHATILRRDLGVDVVIAVTHGSSDYTNQGIAALTGYARVDATFNGHSHQTYVRFESRSGVNMPVMQSGANGTSLGRLTLKINPMKQVYDYSAINLNASSDLRLLSDNATVKAVINEYVLIVEPLLNTVIATSSTDYDRYVLTEYMAKLIRIKSGADAAFHNYGGTRADITNGQLITVATLYQIFPFDNKIKTTQILGSSLKSFIAGTGSQNATSYKDGLSYASIIDNQYYLVATNDYIFDQTTNPFIYGINTIDTGILIRDLLEQVMKYQQSNYGSFSINHPVVLSAKQTGYIRKYDDLEHYINL
jgi:2',3'-cyclic-nucleotide 2'-phosphodiesterase (5'-nucleotidase family)